MHPPCLCKVDCGSLQGCNPFWLATLASLLATAATAVAILRLRRGPAAVTGPSGLLHQGNSSSSEDSGSSTSSSNSSSASSCSSKQEEEEEDQLSEAARPRPVAARHRPMLTADQLRKELEVRLADQRRAQDDLLTQFQAANNRQRRFINDRVTQETARLGGITENLRRRIAEQQNSIREAERTIRDFTRRDLPNPPSTSAPSPRPAPPAPSTRRGRQTRSSPPSIPVRAPLRRSPRQAPTPPTRASPRLAANLPAQYGLFSGQLRPLREDYPPTVIVVPPRQRQADQEPEQPEAGPSRPSPARARPVPRRQ